MTGNNRVEVTEAMIEAGCRAAGLFPSHGYGGNREFVERIFLAMQAFQPTQGEQADPDLVEVIAHIICGQGDASRSIKPNETSREIARAILSTLKDQVNA